MQHEQSVWIGVVILLLLCVALPIALVISMVRMFQDKTRHQGPASAGIS